MSQQFDNGGPAFPTGPNSWGRDESDGMTLRDWFAGQALPQIIAINEKVTANRDAPYEAVLKVTAEHCYRIADAMLSARKGGA